MAQGNEEKEKQMPAKTTTQKKTTAKKTVAKPAQKKKVAVKSITPKKAPACACTQRNMECPCKHQCHCHNHCKFGKIIKKIVVFFIIFALGFATAKTCCFNKYDKIFKPKFENGCLVIKCPKMLQMAPMMDINKDGCINREEFRNAKKFMKRNKRGMRPNPIEESKPEM